MNEELPMWVLYKHPRDFPDKYIARLHVLGSNGYAATPEVLVADELEEVRQQLDAKGLVRLERNENDDPVIVETWL